MKGSGRMWSTKLNLEKYPAQIAPNRPFYTWNGWGRSKDISGPCKLKYYLDPESQFAKYLDEECLGFIKDDQNEYSLNYILIVLVANLDRKKLIVFNDVYSSYLIKCDSRLETLFEEKCISILSLRQYVNDLFFNGQEQEQLSLYSKPIFLCLGKAKQIVKEIFKEDLFEHLHENNCEIENE